MTPVGGKEESVRELIARLIDETKAYVKAEIGVVKSTALAWVDRAKIAVPLIVTAILLVQAALIVLIAAFGMALAAWLGVAGGLAVAAVIVLLIAGVCVGIAVSKVSKAPE
ncbi:small-conductance mechanosensitive channel [Sphingomonas vulcanisoli]|uniref:Small-conductance mechanosensitive channel n=1 Tax=Sphingomonas vulcanisoli TaxID=1658060 RepID=A0ABX0TMT4_9SPHN|nr:phage holin family protein [Sphingomonas vulcanisoli]NIJ06838.1 small-conductance mechanosensitive channel [Sphingomonas vulcanisoli]